jgi:carbamoyl-phosphate synthase large subunit
MLAEEGVDCVVVARSSEEPGPSALERLESGAIDLVINIPRTFDALGRPDGYEIRRRAVDLEITLVTDIELSRLLVQTWTRFRTEPPAIRSWGSYLREGERPASPDSLLRS